MGCVMDDTRSIEIVEGFQEAGSQEEYVNAWQHLVDTGLAWTLEGEDNWIGRRAAQLIAQGQLRDPSITYH